MLIELVDALRCTSDHEEGWLIAVVGEREGGHIARGTLGCPICGAEFPIVDRVVLFGRGSTADARSARASSPAASAPQRALRAAALLDLTDGGGFVALGGGWAAIAPELLTIASVHLLLVDPLVAPPSIDGVSVLRTDEKLPLAASTLRAAALDASSGSNAMLASVVRALKGRGRLLVDAAVTVPADVVELARDDEHWVGERVPTPAQSTPVRLMRSPRDDATA